MLKRVANSERVENIIQANVKTVDMPIHQHSNAANVTSASSFISDSSARKTRRKPGGGSKNNRKGVANPRKNKRNNKRNSGKLSHKLKDTKSGKLSRKNAVRRGSKKDRRNRNNGKFNHHINEEREVECTSESPSLKSELKKIAISTGKHFGELALTEGLNLAKRFTNMKFGVPEEREEGEAGEFDSEGGEFGAEPEKEEVDDESPDDEDEESEESVPKGDTDETELSDDEDFSLEQEEENTSEENDEHDESNDIEEDTETAEDEPATQEDPPDKEQPTLEEDEEEDEEPSEKFDDEEEEGEEEDGDDDSVDKYKTPSGLEYLGAGYDLFKGNPLGDTVTLLDPGYRSNIIQMHWSKSFEGISNSLQFLQPLGGWIRPYTSCHKVETVTEINSADAYLKALSADANVSLELPGDSLKFSASAKFKQIDNNSKTQHNKLYINKSYCFKYAAGMATNIKWYVYVMQLGELSDIIISADSSGKGMDFTLGFESSLFGLSKSFEGLVEGSKCGPSVYRDDPENEHCFRLGIRTWMDLFDIFGTHVTTKIYLGGKTYSTMEVKKSQEEKLKELGVDVSALLSAKVKNADVDSSVEVSVLKSHDNKDYLLDTKKANFVVGGDIYGHDSRIDFDKWAESVSDHSMPIKAEYTPIVQFLHPSLKKAYNDAYIYYSLVLRGNSSSLGK